MFSCTVLALLLGATSASGEKAQCVHVKQDLPPGNFVKQITMQLPNGLTLSGNDMGINNHMTTLTQCSIHDEASGAFGWSFNRGTTEKDCGKPPRKATQCPYQVPGPDPKCYYQFGFHKVQHGINPWGIPSGTNKLRLPVDTSKLKNLDMAVDVNYTWTDLSQPPVSKPPFYRSRLIYDFFISSERPEAHKSKATTITDEIVIDIGYNKDFQLPCGYKGQSPAPLIRNIIKTPEGNYDLMDVQEYDKPCSMCGYNRMTHFRRQGGACSGKGACEVHASLDLMPFINKVKEYKPQSRMKPAGKWLGSVELGTEIYDNIKAEVMFNKFEVGAHPSFSASAAVLV
jgi:hypothetical protein